MAETLKPGEVPDNTAPKPKTRVACKLPGGMLIHRKSLGYDDGTGDGVKMMAGHEGPGIRLNGPPIARDAGGVNDHTAEEAPFGITEIDADWNFAAWLEQNQQNPLVAKKVIYVLDDADEKVAPEYRRLDPNAPA